MKKPSTVDVLRHARRILKERGWTTGAFARNSFDEVRFTSDHDAASFCSLGAVNRAVVELKASHRVCVNAKDALNDVVGYSISLWNDQNGRTKEEVIAKFGEAIKWVQNEGTRS